MPKVKVTIEFEYDLNPKNYPSEFDIKEMIGVDMRSLADGVITVDEFIGDGDFFVNGELVK